MNVVDKVQKLKLLTPKGTGVSFPTTVSIPSSSRVLTVPTLVRKTAGRKGRKGRGRHLKKTRRRNRK